METSFWYDLQKKVFLQRLGAVFAWIFRDFTQIFRDFARIFNKPSFWGTIAHPTFLEASADVQLDLKSKRDVQ